MSDDAGEVDFVFTQAAVDAAEELRRRVVTIVVEVLNPEVCAQLDDEEAVAAVLGGMAGATSVLAAEMLSLTAAGDATLADWVRDCFAGNLRAMRCRQLVDRNGCEGSSEARRVGKECVSTCRTRLSP